MPYYPRLHLPKGNGSLHFNVILMLFDMICVDAQPLTSGQLSKIYLPHLALITTLSSLVDIPHGERR